MDINSFIENFKEAAEIEKNCSLLPETVFRNLDEWSSLSALSILAMVDEEYDVQLKADEMRKTNTIQELFDLVKSHKN